METQEIKNYLQRVLSEIPPEFLKEKTKAEVLKCALFEWLKNQKRLIPVPSFRLAHREEAPLSLVAFDKDKKIVAAFGIAPVITLTLVKSLKAIKTPNKFFITYSTNVQKVKESRFFLSPEIKHIHLTSNL